MVRQRTIPNEKSGQNVKRSKCYKKILLHSMNFLKMKALFYLRLLQSRWISSESDKKSHLKRSERYKTVCSKSMSSNHCPVACFKLMQNGLHVIDGNRHRRCPSTRQHTVQQCCCRYVAKHRTPLMQKFNLFCMRSALTNRTYDSLGPGNYHFNFSE